MHEEGGSSHRRHPVNAGAGDQRCTHRRPQQVPSANGARRALVGVAVAVPSLLFLLLLLLLLLLLAVAVLLPLLHVGVHVAVDVEAQRPPGLGVLVVVRLAPVGVHGQVRVPVVEDVVVAGSSGATGSGSVGQPPPVQVRQGAQAGGRLVLHPPVQGGHPPPLLDGLAGTGVGVGGMADTHH